MKQLFNYCPVMHYEQEMAKREGGIQGYLKECGLQGIELFVYGEEPFPNHFELYKELTVGVHLKFWPIWLDFWLQNKERLARMSQEELDKQFGATTKAGWLERIKANIKTALLYEPDYLVWHVSDARLEEIYTYKHFYDSHQVLEATIEVYNLIKQVIPKNVTVLFENLWWPGLNLLEPAEVKYFLEALAGENIGIMLDTGHLMNTNCNLKTEQEGVDFICATLEKLGEYKKYVKGMHLSCSLSGAYHSRLLPERERKYDPMSVGRHISQLDQHRCFKEAGLKKLIDLVQPDYVTHELFFNDFEQLKGFLKLQQPLLDR